MIAFVTPGFTAVGRAPVGGTPGGWVGPGDGFETTDPAGRDPGRESGNEETP